MDLSGSGCFTRERNTTQATTKWHPIGQKAALMNISSLEMREEGGASWMCVCVCDEETMEKSGKEIIYLFREWQGLFLSWRFDVCEKYMGVVRGGGGAGHIQRSALRMLIFCAMSAFIYEVYMSIFLWELQIHHWRGGGYFLCNELCTGFLSVSHFLKYMSQLSVSWGGRGPHCLFSVQNWAQNWHRNAERSGQLSYRVRGTLNCQVCGLD